MDVGIILGQQSSGGGSSGNSGVVISNTAPDDHNVLWLDTSTYQAGILKSYATGEWAPIMSVWS